VAAVVPTGDDLRRARRSTMGARLGLWRFGDEALEVAADHDEAVVGKRDVAGLGIIVGRRWRRRRRRKVIKFGKNSDRR